MAMTVQKSLRFFAYIAISFVSRLSSSSAERRRRKEPFTAMLIRPVYSDTTTAMASELCDMPIAAR